MQQPRTTHTHVLIAALLVLLCSLLLPSLSSSVRAFSPVARVFAVYSDGTGEQEMTFTEGVNAPYGHTTPVPCGPGKVVFEMMSHAQILDMASGTYTELPTQGYWFSCSRDGKFIAFTGGVNYTTWIMGVDGSNPHEISQTQRAYHPTWSPDGTKIAFDLFYTGPQASLMSLAEATGGRVESINTLDGPMAITPVGVKIVNADGTGEAPVTTYGGHPSFSPDGTQLAFESGHGGISTIDLTSGTIVQVFLDAPVYWAMEPSWSSTGVLAYTSYLNTDPIPGDRTAKAEIWTYNFSTRADARLTSGSQPAWSPDGSFLTFARETSQEAAGPGVSITGSFGIEGQVGVVNIRRFGDTTTEIHGIVRFHNGSAHGSTTPGSEDFNSSSQPFILFANQITTTVSVALNNDGEAEVQESFTAYLTDLQSGHIEGSGVATMFIDEVGVDPITIVEPPQSDTPVIYSTAASAGLSVFLPATSQPVHFAVLKDGKEVFTRDTTADNVIIGAASQSLAATSPEIAHICVWGTMTSNGCPGMPDSVKEVNATVAYELKVTFQNQTATRPFVTEFKMYQAFLPDIRSNIIIVSADTDL